MFHSISRMYVSQLMFWAVLCTVSMLPVQVTGLKLETDGVTIPMTDIDPEARIITQPGLPSYRLINKIDGSIYIGSNETLSRLSLNGNNEVKEDQTILTTNEPVLVVSCAVQNPSNKEIVCWNFIRIAEATSERLLVCGTNAFSPQCYSCTLDLDCTPINGTIGPESRDGSSAATLFSDGTLYFGNDADNIFEKFAVGNLDTSNPITKQLDTVTTGGRFIKDATFVGKPFEYTHSDGTVYIFVFYRETALEYSNHGMREFSRIARVCKNDTGGTVNTEKFVTFIKARLNCSVPDELLPFYFDNIQDVIWDSRNNEVYAIFTTRQDGPQASALCRFRMEDIMKLFDEGEFKDQAGGQADNEWLPQSPSSPRPGTCNEVHTTTYPPLMDKLVPNYNPLEPTTGFQVSPPSNFPISDTPTLYVDGVRFTCMAIDMDNSVYFFGTSEGSVLKHANGKTVEINELGTTGAITGLELLEDNSVKHLVITTDNNVITWALNNECSARSQQECEIVRAPYCQWTGGVCNCSSSNTHCKTELPDVLKVRPENITSCDNTDVYLYCEVDAGPYRNINYNLTWVKADNETFLIDESTPLIGLNQLSDTLLQLRVTMHKWSEGIYNCTMTGGDKPVYKSVKVTMTNCSTCDSLEERRIQHKMYEEAEKDILNENGTCSVKVDECNHCGPNY